MAFHRVGVVGTRLVCIICVLHRYAAEATPDHCHGLDSRGEQGNHENEGELYESVHGRKPPEFGRLHVRLLQEAVAAFKAMLADRGNLGAYDTLEYHLDLIGYPLEQLDIYLTTGAASRLNERDAAIFVHFAQSEFKMLLRMAIEIDENYERVDSDT